MTMSGLASLLYMWRVALWRTIHGPSGMRDPLKERNFLLVPFSNLADMTLAVESNIEHILTFQ